MPRLFAVLGVCLVSSPAFADTSYEVTATSGASDFDEAQCLYGNLEGTPDGVTPIDPADALGDGELSLVEAICLANHDLGPTVIDLAGLDIDLAGGMNSAFYGINMLPIIRSTITVVGHGATVRGAAAQARYFFVAGAFHDLGAGDLTLVDLTLRGGRAVGNTANVTGASAGLGGAIYNQGTLVLERVLALDNQARGGSAVLDVGGASLYGGLPGVGPLWGTSGSAGGDNSVLAVSGSAGGSTVNPGGNGADGGGPFQDTPETWQSGAGGAGGDGAGGRGFDGGFGTDGAGIPSTGGPGEGSIAAEMIGTGGGGGGGGADLGGAGGAGGRVRFDSGSRNGGDGGSGGGGVGGAGGATVGSSCYVAGRPGGGGGFGAGGGRGAQTTCAVAGGGGPGGFGGGGGGGAAAYPVEGGSGYHSAGAGADGGFGGGRGGSGSRSKNGIAGGGAGMGGVVFNHGGAVTIVDCAFIGNIAAGGDGMVDEAPDPDSAGSGGGSAHGGAIFNLNGVITVSGSLFAGNTVTAGGGEYPGTSDGADTYNHFQEVGVGNNVLLATESGTTITVGDSTALAALGAGQVVRVGAAVVTLALGANWADPGAVAADPSLGIVRVTAAAPDLASVGTKTVTYAYTDGDGIVYASATRTIEVVDTTPPTITLNSNNPLVWTQGVPFVDPGAIAHDDVDGEVALLGQGTVNTDLPGQATLTYRYTDAAGNAATPVTRTVNVVAYNQAGAPDASAKLLPNGTGDGYADYATDAFGAVTSSECGGGLNADGTPKPLGAAEFDPWSGGLVTDRPRGGVMCNARIYLFALDRSARQIIASGPNGWSGQGPNNLYPDGTPLTVGVRAADLVAESWIGPDNEVRRTRFFPHLFPGLQVDLDQRASCAALTQVYRFTNVGTQSISFRLTQVADSDLGFGANFTQNYGRWDTQDPYTSWIYNNAKDVGLMMRSRVDFDTDFEGWRVKLQGSAGWDHLRAGMYYGFPTTGFDVARCEANPSGTNCPTPDHLNKVFASASGSHPNNYYISPDGGSNVESNNDPDGDGWSNSRWDVDQVLQSVYLIAPGESREYRTLYEGLPSYCRVQTDAGFDHVVAVAAASACAATVTLDGGDSTVAGNATADTTYTWYGEGGAEVGQGVSVQATVVGAGEHRFDLKVCNGDGICDTDFVVVIATDDDGTCADTDGDGLVDAVDLDDDDDGIPDVAEAAADTDDDGLVDGHDLDSDGDGIPDLLEGDDVQGVGATDRDALVDSDGDGRVDLETKLDANDNGWDDRFEAAPPALPDNDEDGTPDVRDTDDDGDLIPTSLECPDRRPCPSVAGQPDYLNVATFACQALGVATANGLLGAGGAGHGSWFVGSQSFAAVARDGFTGHLYALTSTGVLWRVTPGAELELGPTGLTNPVALTASPYPDALVAVDAGANTSTFYDVALDGTSTARDTVDGTVGDVAFDASGKRVYSRTLVAQHQLVFVDRTVVTTSLVHGLAVRSGGTVIGLVRPDANTLRVVAIAANGAFTSLYEPTRSWRPGIAPSGNFDFAGCQANLAPTLRDDLAITPYQTAVTVTPLTNDTDDGATGEVDATSLVVGTPSGGTAVATGTDVLVTPPSGFVGAVTFDYTAEDDANLTGSATVTVYVAPDAQPDSQTRAQGAAASTLALATNDVAHATSTYTLDGAPAWATLAGSTLTVAPPANVSGTFSFAYDHCYATPIGPACDRAAVTLVINAAPALTSANSGTGTGGAAVTLDVVTIYSDPEGHALDAASITTTLPPGCVVSVTRTNTTLAATPGSQPGVCAISVRACDTAPAPACGTNTWTVTVNDPPIGGTVVRTVGTNDRVTWDLATVLAGVQPGVVDSGIDYDQLSVAALGAEGTTAVTALGGLCSLDVATGLITYDAPAVTGMDTCRLNVCENAPGAACTVVTFDLTVIDSLAPTAEAFVTPVGTPLAIPVTTLLANDVGAAPATFSLVGVSSGVATLTGGVIAFTPAAAGLVTLTYRVCAAVDPTTCVDVADVIYVRAPPTVAGADLWFATPTASGAHTVTLAGPFPARADGTTTTQASGANTVVAGATLTLTPANPAIAGTYRTTVSACDAPALSVPCVGGGSTVAYCGNIAVAEACATADITWTWNDPPNLATQSISALPGATTLVPLASLYVDAGLVSGDADGDGDALDEDATTVVEGPCTIVGGALQIVAPATIGAATCQVRMCEERPALAACATVAISIDVLGGDTVANDDRYVIAQGDRLDLDAASGPATNDSVVSGSTFVAGALDAAAGVIAMAADGALAFDPDAAFVGEATFDYTLSDDFGRSDVATVTLIVNDPPELATGASSVSPGTAASVGLDEILLSTGAWHGDDPDDGDADGIATPTTDGACSYVAGAFVFDAITMGSATCTITICEELPAVEPRACTTVTWAINVVADPVLASDDAYVMAMASTLMVAAPGVLGNDAPATATVALVGSATGLSLAADGSFVYTPPTDFAGTTRVDYRLTDAFGTAATASLSILVNDPPNLQPVTRTMAPNSAETLSLDALIADLGVVFGDDPDDGDDDGIGPVSLASEVDGGPCEVTPAGIALTAPASGSTTCELQICEEIPAADSGVCALVVVTIVVPDAIVATNDRYVTVTDAPLMIDTIAAGLLGNDIASNGVVDEVDVPGLALAVDGTFVYTPAPGFAGEVVFDYTVVVNGVAGPQSAKAVVTIIVNDPPTGITSTEVVAAGTTTTWTFDALVETYGAVDLGLDPESVAVTSGPCAIVDGELVITATITTTCTVAFCEAEPIAPRACGEATLTLTIAAEPTPSEDEFLASGGGGCAGGGASLVLLPLFVWAARRRRVTSR